jgi:hypothetical protein
VLEVEEEVDNGKVVLQLDLATMAVRELSQ